jgi:DNA-binding transcriptional ArsR family regulator
MKGESAPLLKILGDETRRRILLLLDEKGSLGYTELMNLMGISNTGTFNYHLKVLGELLHKTDAGHYTLSEKGKLAVHLLLDFPEDNNELYKQWLRAEVMSKEINFRILGAIYWLLALFSLIILVGLKALTLNSLVIPWIWFIGGAVYFVRDYWRKSKKNKHLVKAPET